MYQSLCFFPPLFFNYFQILGITLECALENYCEKDQLKEHLEKREPYPRADKATIFASSTVSEMLLQEPLVFPKRQCGTTAGTHYVHEGEEVVLDVFFAVESDDRVIHA